MPLILAIEPDRRQAAHLTAVVRRRVGAELILVDTTESALDAIGNRVPDLMLVPALLSPQDDAALAGALRMIATAAHVQMLTIPVLAASRPPARSGGVLAALRRDKSRDQTPDGCDPAVFAEQISSYLQHVAEEHPEPVEIVREEHPVEEPAVEERAVKQLAVEELVVEEPAVEELAVGQLAVQQLAVEELVVEQLAVEQLAVEELVVEEPAAEELAVERLAVLELAVEQLAIEGPPAVAEPLPVVAKPAAMPVLDEFLAALEQMPLPVIEQIVDDEWPDPDVDEDEDDIDLTAALDEAAVPMIPQEEEVVEVVGRPPSMMALAEMAREDEKLWMSLSFGSGFTWPALEGAPVEPPIEERKVEWVELIASLRQDVERMRSEGVQPAAKRRSRKQKPVQDEWGFFDPEQCGFAALLAKLDEVTEVEEGGRA